MSLRIIGGSLGGRQFDSPPGQRAHPMSDRIRGALFNALGDLSGLVVLDAFGGSGALGFEALSRGAAKATICENDPRLASTIAQGAQQLDLKDQIKLVDRSVYSWLRETKELYDLILVDPPYQEFAEHRLENFLPALQPTGTLVVSLPSDQDTPEMAGTRLIKHKAYGNAALAFYRKTD